MSPKLFSLHIISNLDEIISDNSPKFDYMLIFEKHVHDQTNYVKSFSDMIVKSDDGRDKIIAFNKYAPSSLTPMITNQIACKSLFVGNSINHDCVINSYIKHLIEVPKIEIYRITNVDSNKLYKYECNKIDTDIFSPLYSCLNIEKFLIRYPKNNNERFFNLYDATSLKYVKYIISSAFSIISVKHVSIPEELERYMNYCVSYKINNETYSLNFVQFILLYNTLYRNTNIKYITRFLRGVKLVKYDGSTKYIDQSQINTFINNYSSQLLFKTYHQNDDDYWNRSEFDLIM